MSGQPLSGRRRVVTLVAMCVAQGMILLDNTIVNVALPPIQRELDVEPGNLIWIVNAYVLALASLIMVGGTLGDRYGRKRVFVIGLAIFTAMSAACAMSPNESVLIAARAAQGVGAALVAPLSLSILADAYPPERRTAAIGIWAAAAGLGFGAGPVIGGILVELFSWSAVFWVNVPIGIIGLALVITGVREPRNPHARRLDVPGAVLIAAGLCVLTFAIVESEHFGWTSPTMIALLAAAGVSLISFLVVESRVSEPMVPLGLFRDSRFTVSCGVYAIMYLALASTFFYVTLFFRRPVVVDHEHAVPDHVDACRPPRGLDRYGDLLARRSGRRTRSHRPGVPDTGRGFAGGVARLRADRGGLRDGSTDDLIRCGVGAAGGTQRIGLWRTEFGSSGGYGRGTRCTGSRRAGRQPQLLGGPI